MNDKTENKPVVNDTVAVLVEKPIAPFDPVNPQTEEQRLAQAAASPEGKVVQNDDDFATADSTNDKRSK